MMRVVEVFWSAGKIIIDAVFFFYGEVASRNLSGQTAEIKAAVEVTEGQNDWFDMRYKIKLYNEPGSTQETVNKQAPLLNFQDSVIEFYKGWVRRSYSISFRWMQA